METVLIIGVAMLVVVFIYMATPNTYTPKPLPEFKNRLNRTHMHAALLVNSALNIKNMGNGISRHGAQEPEESKSAFNGCCNDKSLDVKPADCQPGKNKVMNLRAVSVVRDDNAHWYVIPKELHEEFRSLLEKSTDTSLKDDEMYDAQNKFIEKFSQYMTGGDLNNVQLYAEI
jgi:hypothetical protein